METPTSNRSDVESSAGKDAEKKKSADSKRKRVANFFRGLLSGDENSPKKAADARSGAEKFTDTLREMFRSGDSRQASRAEHARINKERVEPVVDYAEHSRPVQQAQYDTQGNVERVAVLSAHEQGTTRTEPNNFRARLKSRIKRVFRRRPASSIEQSQSRSVDQVDQGRSQIPRVGKADTPTRLQEAEDSGFSSGELESTQQPGQQAHERVRVIRERDPTTPAFAALSIYALLKARSARKEQRKLNQDVKSLSEEVKTQRKQLEEERYKKTPLGGIHSPPVERTTNYQTSQLREQVKALEPLHRPTGAAGSREQMDESASMSEHKNDVHGQPLRGASMSESRLPQEQGLPASNERSDTAHLVRGEQVSAKTAARAERNIATYNEAESVKNIIAQREQDFAYSPERLERSNRRSAKPAVAGTSLASAKQRSKEAYQKLKQSATSYSANNRSTLTNRKTGRLYAEVSPFTVWVAIIGGWVLFFLLMVWLLREVFGIL